MRIQLHRTRQRVLRSQHGLRGDAWHGAQRGRVRVGHTKLEAGVGVMTKETHLVHRLRSLCLLHLPGAGWR